MLAILRKYCKTDCVNWSLENWNFEFTITHYLKLIAEVLRFPVACLSNVPSFKGINLLDLKTTFIIIENLTKPQKAVSGGGVHSDKTEVRTSSTTENPRLIVSSRLRDNAKTDLDQRINQVQPSKVLSRGGAGSKLLSILAKRVQIYYIIFTFFLTVRILDFWMKFCLRLSIFEP